MKNDVAVNDGMVAREVASEQAFVDTVYRQLAASTRSAESSAVM